MPLRALFLVFFGVRSIFISPNEDQSCIFTRVKIPLLVFMSEIKINLTPEKIKFSVSFMLKCGKIFDLYQSVSRHHRKLISFFPSHFASVL